jgi:hypothetical protein
MFYYSNMTSRESLESEREQLTLAELENMLTLAGTDLSLWGLGAAKTVAHLHREIAEGESVVQVTDTGAVERSSRVVWVDVFYADQQGNVYHLVEDRQEFSDGRVRRRQLASSLGEKLKLHEDPDEAAMRALSEELGIEASSIVHKLGRKQMIDPSDSYPGLINSSDAYGYAIELADESFRADGYVERQADKTNHYAWELIYSVEL